MHIAVLDVGKTNAKVVVVDGTEGREIATRSTPNRVLTSPPYPHYDAEAIWRFFLETLAAFRRDPGYEAISVTAHGASGVLLAGEGLALPILDYEFEYPEAVRADYDRLRPPYSETFSPRLPGGLNLGAQLHYQRTMFPAEYAAATALVTYPQYWSWRLTGVTATELTSIGCHTDLWMPTEGRFSELVDRLDLIGRVAWVRSAFDVLGPVRPAFTERLGDVPVHCGIHDSNASLLPHVLSRQPPFAVVSTGTWVILLAPGGSTAGLDAGRDTLVNVDALGRPVPSARFMGGREFELLTGGEGRATPLAIARVLDEDIMVPPGIMPGTGPFPGARTDPGPIRALDPDLRYVAVSLYEALMTRVSLDLIGARGPVIVEGPFGRNALFVEALAALLGRSVEASPGATGTSVGAALLAGAQPRPFEGAVPPPRSLPAAFAAYAARWMAAFAA